MVGPNAISLVTFFFLSVSESQVVDPLDSDITGSMQVIGSSAARSPWNCDWCDEHTRAVFTHTKRLPFFSLASLSRTERQLRALPAARRANGLNCDASAIYRIVWQPNSGRTRLPLPPTTSRAATPLSPYPFPTLAYQLLICLSPFSSSRVKQHNETRIYTRPSRKPEYRAPRARQHSASQTSKHFSWFG